MAQGQINVTGGLLENWYNECMHQLGMKTNDNVNNITPAGRDNITVDRVAIVLRFDHGPPVILGGTSGWWNGAYNVDGSFTYETISGSSLDKEPWDTGAISLARAVLDDDIATRPSRLNTASDILVASNGQATTGSQIKFVADVVAPLEHVSTDVLDEWRYIGGTSAASGTDVGIFPSVVSTTDSQVTYNSNIAMAKGWGITFGTVTATGTKPNEGSLFINSPSALPVGQGSYLPDTKLYKMYSANAFSAVASSGWDELPDLTENEDAETSYNHGTLDHIDLWVSIKGTVIKEATDDATSWTGPNDWYKLIGHDLDSSDIQDPDNNGYVGTTDADELNKFGWWGALDKDEESSELDVNDAVQDVRIRFSQGINIAGTMSSNAWNPEDFMNWAFHRTNSDFKNFTNEYLLPSRVSILSSYSGFVNNSECLEVGTAVANDQWERLSTTGTIKEVFSTISRQHGAGTPMRYIKSAEPSDNGLINGISISTLGNRPQIVIETNTVDFGRQTPENPGNNTDQHGEFIDGNNLVHDANETNTASTAISSLNTVHGWTGTAWSTNSGHSKEADTAGSEAGGADFPNSTTGDINDHLTGISSDEILDRIFTHGLTLVLFDPKLWWSDATHGAGEANTTTGNDPTYLTRKDHGFWTNNVFTYKSNTPAGSWWPNIGGAWTQYRDNRLFHRYDVPSYSNVKVIFFQPHPNFGKSDKFKITIPLGKSPDNGYN